MSEGQEIAIRNMRQILQNSRIDVSFTWNDYEKGLESFAQRIESCSSMDWLSLGCNSCGKMIKPNCAKLSCLSPYCMDKECVKNRMRLSMRYFNSLKIKSKKLLHIVFGFPKVIEFNRGIREQHNKFFRMLKKEMQKLGTPLRMVVVRDLNGEKRDLYAHYHTANLPVKDWRKFRQNLFICREKIMKKMKIEFSIKFLHYRKTWSLFKYFSYRVAGLFQNSDKEKFGYSRLMDLKEYYDCFYRSRKVKLIGLRAPSPQASILALTLDNLVDKCPHCSSKDISFKPNYLIEDVKPPPPPFLGKDNEKIKVEVVRV